MCVCKGRRLWCVCVLRCEKCGSEGLFFEVWLYQCVFFVHSNHSSWNSADNWGFTVLSMTLYLKSLCVCDSGGDECCLVCVWCVWQSVSLIAIIVVFVITAEGRETPQTDSIWEKYLGTCVHPHLERKTKKERVGKKGCYSKGMQNTLWL